MSEKKWSRLPLDVKPILYDLFLRADLKNFTFNGKETITLEIEHAVDRIVLNSKKLNIATVKLVLINSQNSVLLPEIQLHDAEEIVILQFSDDVPVGKAELVIEFDGELSDSCIGFYRFKQSAVSDEEIEYCAVTQFEPAHARKAFPCWDEPAFKARFDITLEVDSTKTALSNMPVESETAIVDGVGRKRVTFERTPIMSTYLVAFAIGRFDYVEDTTSDGTLVRVYTSPGRKDQGKFALHVTTKALPYYKEYFQVAYPLPKIDLLAVSELSFGAMENWGLITYKDIYLLVDETDTSVTTKQEVALTVGHELAHQWFGNLVTMEWWTHLWLNEGYASFIEHLCVDHLFPEYNIWTQFVARRYSSALELDALKNSHPIEVPVSDPSDINEIFDIISYNKGAAVIRMLHKYIGESDFRKGMNLYLIRHQYGNTSTEDLWAALEDASGKPIKNIMPTWTEQVGFPVITVENSVQKGDTRTFTLSQSKFCMQDGEKGEEASWLIPILFSAQSSPDEVYYRTVMETRQQEIVIPDTCAQKWIKLNPGAVGYYRVKYPSELLQQFVPFIQDKTLPVSDRLNLLDDLLALAQVGQASTDRTLQLIWAMKEEDDYSVWAKIVNCFDKVRRILADTDYSELFNEYGLRVLKPVYEKLGFETVANESHLTTLLRDVVLQSMLKLGAKDFTDLARDKFEKHCRGTTSIAANQRDIVYKTVLAADGSKALVELLTLFKKSDMLEEKSRILESFTAITDVHSVNDVIEFAQSDGLSPSSALIAITMVSYSSNGRTKTFNWIKDHYDQLHEKYSGEFGFAHLIRSSTRNFVSEETADELEAFFATKDTSGAERTIRQSLETIRNNAAWLRRDGESIKQFLVDFHAQNQ